MTPGDHSTTHGPHLVLVGLMGAGKTTVGRLVAEATARRFVDLDDAVVAETGRSVAELFAERGEDGFRDLEEQVLAGVLGAERPTVVATGGGAVLRAANRDRMRRRALVVWLRADAATLADRVGGGQGRPLLGDDPAGALVRLEAQRAPLYAEVAHRVIDVAELGEPEVAAQVGAALAGAAR